MEVMKFNMASAKSGRSNTCKVSNIILSSLPKNNAVNVLRFNNRLSPICAEFAAVIVVFIDGGLQTLNH